MTIIRRLGAHYCRDWSDIVLEEIRRSLKHIHLGKERSREDEYGRCMITLKTQEHIEVLLHIWLSVHILV